MIKKLINETIIRANTLKIKQKLNYVIEMNGID